MADHQPMPVAGYTAQSQSNVDLANEGKELEERYLRWLDKLAAHPDTDTRLRVAIKQAHGLLNDKPATMGTEQWCNAYDDWAASPVVAAIRARTP